MVGGAVCLVATIPGQASADPPGNNGTVKIDGIDFDDHPDNEPHVGCVFQVDWYGFDEGEDLFSDVTFEVHPPTGSPEVILTDEVFIGEDDNSGGGSEAGLDASATYDLTSVLQGFEPHPQQGWHIKLTVNNDGSQGADVKHKVFWVSGCETPPTTTTSTSTSTTEAPTTSTTEEATTSTTEEATTSTTEAPTTSTTEEATTSTTEEATTSTTEEATTSTTEEATTSTTEEATTSTTEQATTSTTEEATTSTTEQATTSTTEQATTSSTEATSTTTVAPSSTTTSMAVSPVGQLPKTGSSSQTLLLVAGATLLLGGGALLASAKLGQRRLA
jgi:LPXTG-motif cell wall-anchored protein